MPTSLEDKLSRLIHEIKEIKKDIILQEIAKTSASRQKINRWKRLGEKVSSRWDNVSAVEEISLQREKTW